MQESCKTNDGKSKKSYEIRLLRGDKNVYRLCKNLC